MRAQSVLHKLLSHSSLTMHANRRSSMIESVAAIVNGSNACISDIGRGLFGDTTVKHKIKRVDRLVGNPHLDRERESVYALQCRWMLRGIKQPIILIDWSCLSADQGIQLLRAGVAIGGRTLTLYEQVHPLAKLGNKRVQQQFMDCLYRLVPRSCCPVVLADSGFRSPFYQYVEQLGWHWVGRIRGLDYVSLRDGEKGWMGAKTLYKQARTSAKDLGAISWTRANQFRARAVIYKRRLKGRKSITHEGYVRRTHTSLKAAKREREPWLLVASHTLDHRSAIQIVKLYTTRMQIELGFRDTKSDGYGLSLREGVRFFVST